ncbi:MAG: hypothetical protein ABII09_03505 [Planctomycetota bacterium]
MKNEITKQEKTYLERIIELFKNIVGNTKELADNYVAMIDECPGSKERLIAELEKRGSRIPTYILNRLEQIGRGQMHPKLMPGLTEIRESGKLRRLPLSVQRDIIDKGKKYPLLTGSKLDDNLLIDLTQSPKEQINQIIDPDGHIRSLSEQKLWLVENEKKDEKAEDAEMPYKITSKGAVIRGLLFTKAQLKEIIFQL